MSDTEQLEKSGIVKVEQGRIAVKPSSKLPGNRPVSESGLQVASYFHSAGADRPIGAAHMQIVEYIGGNRPVMASGLEISELYSVMGNRPVASNEIDDSYSLMGYID